MLIAFFATTDGVKQADVVYGNLKVYPMSSDLGFVEGACLCVQLLLMVVSLQSTDDFQGDILIEGEQIVAVCSPGTFASMQSDAVIDAQGKYVFPGAIDVHTHMELPLPTTVASDDFETGTIAAACGGTTTSLILPISSAAIG